MENAIVRVPELADAEVIRLVNGPEAFTPDGEFILGPTDVRGFWVAAGFCAHGLAGAGGMGKLVAEWIVEGVPSLDVWEMDSRRFGRHYASREYTLARTIEIYSTYYDVKYPGHERQAGRPLRLSPTYRGFRSSAPPSARSPAGSGRTGSSRTRPRGDESLRPRGWAGRLWSPAIGAEHRALPRDRRALRRDLVREDRGRRARAPPPSSSGSAPTASRATSARSPTRQMLNERGGIECDFTVTRLAEDRFRIVTGHRVRPARPRVDPLARPEDGSVRRRGRHVALRVPRASGARARATILEPLTDGRSLERRFPYMRARELAVGPSRASRCASPTSASSAGSSTARWSSGFALWDAIWAAGTAARPRRRRLQGDRLLPPGEGLPRLGRDITPEDTPYEAGLGFAVKLDKEDFIGRDALVAANGASRAQARLPRPRRPALGRARLGAGARRRPRGRPRHERRLRLHGRALDRLRLPPADVAEVGTAGRGRDLRRLGRGRGSRRAAVRPGRTRSAPAVGH